MRLTVAALTVAFVAMASAPLQAQISRPGLPDYHGPPEDAPIEYLTPLIGIGGTPVPKLEDTPLTYAVCMLGIQSNKTVYYTAPFRIHESDKGPQGYLPVEKKFWDYVATTYKVDVKDPGIYGCDGYFDLEDVGNLEETVRAMFMESRYTVDVETAWVPNDANRVIAGYDPNNRPAREEREDVNDAAR